MKLAEALQERADLNYKISDLELRLTQNSLVQEGETPNENPEELLKTLDQCVTRLQKLIAHINLTNCKTIVEGLGGTINVYSQLKEGSRFSVILPLNRLHK